jgi:hypothetical protein
MIFLLVGQQLPVHSTWAPRAVQCYKKLIYGLIIVLHVYPIYWCYLSWCKKARLPNFFYHKSDICFWNHGAQDFRVFLLLTILVYLTVFLILKREMIIHKYLFFSKTIICEMHNARMVEIFF